VTGQGWELNPHRREDRVCPLAYLTIERPSECLTDGFLAPTLSGRANHSTRDTERETPPADAPPAWDQEPDEEDEETE
jgi:hypothetical protein